MVRYHAGQCLLPGFDLTLYRRASISAYDPNQTSEASLMGPINS